MAMIEQLKNILSAEEESVSALLDILSTQEKIKLSGYFDSATDEKHDKDDINIKFFALNALFIYIKNNPSVENELKANAISTEDLALKIYELSTIVYGEEKSWEHYFYLTAYGTLADKQTLLTEQDSLAEPVNFPEKTLRFFVAFSLPTGTRNALSQRHEELKGLKEDFSEIQIPENINSQEQLYEIAALSNLVSLGEKVQNYLLKGIEMNVPASINNGTANAIKVFSEAGNRKWELICSLLRFVLHKYYENSIWTYANRLPFFRDFAEQQLAQGSFIFSLFPSQRAALQDVLASHKSTVISMPTSSGKTFLAELKILYIRSIYQQDCVCAYIAPTNALVNQTVKRLKTSLPDLKVEQLLPYNHFDSLEKELVGDQPDILVSTPEKLNFLLKNEGGGLLDKLRLIVIDEAHNISTPNRGSIWEFLLANLKQNDEQLSYLLLTPFIKNKDELAKWLGGESSLSKSIEWTPTKQYVAYHSLHSGKTQSKINYLPSARNSIIKEEVSIDLSIDPQSVKEELGESAINHIVRNAILVEKYARQSGCILILNKGTGSVENLANKLAAQFNFSSDNQTDKLNYAKEVIRQELGIDHSLLNLLDKGIAFHHSQLSPLVKETVEDLVTEDAIKILVATTTLAQGMNFPIKTVIFETTTLGGGASSKKLTYNEFWNIAGRAGRAYKDTEGHIVLGWKDTIQKTRQTLESFIKQDVEETISSLKEFFDELQGNELIDYQFIKDNPVAQNFLHYLNHLMNISYQYKPDSVTRQDLVNILANSLYFRQNEFSEGFLETQEKVVNFSDQYISLIQKKDAGQLKLADALGITDISLSTIIGITQENGPLLSECIYNNDTENLAIIINAINIIPELKISLGREEGLFNSALIAGILLDWINGRSIPEISRANDITTNECSGYIFSRLKNYIPWGMAIYQKISKDQNELLPSYAFYGVKDEKSVRLSYIGVPRFALNKVKAAITDDNLYKDTHALRAFIRTKEFVLAEEASRNHIVNQIIKSSILS